MLKNTSIDSGDEMKIKAIANRARKKNALASNQEKKFFVKQSKTDYNSVLEYNGLSCLCV